MWRIVSSITMVGAMGAAACLTGCSAEHQTEEQQANAVDEAQIALSAFRQAMPRLDERLDNAYGYAIFPQVGKGAVGVGGAYGEGVVFEQGVAIGNTTLSQGTVGLQLGGQAYRELILFQNKEALDDFTAGNFEFAAQASAVAATAGASTDADYSKGVLVYTLTTGGLMFEASIGGQQFSFHPYYEPIEPRYQDNRRDRDDMNRDDRDDRGRYDDRYDDDMEDRNNPGQ